MNFAVMSYQAELGECMPFDHTNIMSTLKVLKKQTLSILNICIARLFRRFDYLAIECML